jgi:hypothetical protein
MNRVQQFKHMLSPEDFLYFNLEVIKAFNQNLDEFLAETNTPREAILKAIDWEKSRQGIEYWSTVCIYVMCNFKQWND